MSFWSEVNGYMIIEPEIPDCFGKHAGVDDWTRKVMYQPHEWVSRLLPAMREAWDREHAWRTVLPGGFYIDWETYEDDGTVVYDDDICYIPDEDAQKLRFPAGSEGPMSMTISTRLDPFYGMQFHVVFDGNLRDVENIDAIVEWWETIKKYLVIKEGHIFAASEDTYYEDSVHSVHKSERKVYDKKISS